MLENQNEIKKITSSMIKFFEKQGDLEISSLLAKAYPSSKEIGWDRDITIYSIDYELEIDVYLQYRPLIEKYSKQIKDTAELFLRDTNCELLGVVRIVPICRQYLRWGELTSIATKQDVLNKIEVIKNAMISVSTGGPKIEKVDPDYIKSYSTLAQWLDKLDVENPNMYKNLWEWYGRWSQTDLGTYASRRTYISNLYQPLIEIVTKSTEVDIGGEYIPTGWERVDRSVYEMKSRISIAVTEEQFQTIGMLGRETIITIAQEVFNKKVHIVEDGIDPSNTDAKRMLDAFLGHELSGGSNEKTRKFAKSAVDLANQLTHDRMATRRDASMCLISVTAVASIIKLIHETTQPIASEDELPF